MRYETIAKKLLQRYWRFSRALTLGVRAAVIDGDGRLLLVRHTYTHGWHFPGGGVEFNETVHAALERELSEEAGIGLTSGAAELFGLYASGQQFPGDHVALFVVRAWERKRAFVLNREIAEVGLFAPDALPEDTTRATLRRIGEINGVRSKDTYW